MTSTTETHENGNTQELVPLGEDRWPRSEAQQTFGHLLEKIKLGFSTKAFQDAIDSSTTFVSCAIRNYPDIRSELNAAGLNLDKL